MHGYRQICVVPPERQTNFLMPMVTGLEKAEAGSGPVGKAEAVWGPWWRRWWSPVGDLDIAALAVPCSAVVVRCLPTNRTLKLKFF